MLCEVKGNPVHRRGPRRKAPPADPATALRDAAVKLHDRGDGHGVDWATAAAFLLKAAFSCLDEAKGDARAYSVARRVHDGAYNRMSGSPDSATPYAADPTQAPSFMPESDLHPDPELNH
jgi:hypothetical protein